MRQRFTRDERKAQLIRAIRRVGVESTRQLTMAIGMSPNSSSYVGGMLRELRDEGWLWSQPNQVIAGIAPAVIWGLEDRAWKREYDGQYLLPLR